MFLRDVSSFIEYMQSTTSVRFKRYVRAAEANQTKEYINQTFLFLLFSVVECPVHPVHLVPGTLPARARLVEAPAQLAHAHLHLLLGLGAAVDLRVQAFHSGREIGAPDLQAGHTEVQAVAFRAEGLGKKVV
jgi:hypothetical protein